MLLIAKIMLLTSKNSNSGGKISMVASIGVRLPPDLHTSKHLDF